MVRNQMRDAELPTVGDRAPSEVFLVDEKFHRRGLDGPRVV
jgi:hypothetical protein